MALDHDNMHTRIASLTIASIPAAMELVSVAGWNQTPDDWQRVIDYQPDGCFCAAADGRLVGTVTTTCYGQQLGWIGMMLVHPDMRRQGVGMQLMQRAIDSLRLREMHVIGLDATPAGRPLYERLGFQAAFDFERWQRPAVTQTVTPAPSDPLAAAPPMYEELEEFLMRESVDREAFGVERRDWLMRLAHQSKVVRRDANGFAMLRAGRIADYLGPIVSRSENSAIGAIESLVQSTERSIVWDVIQPTDRIVQLARHLGFAPVRTLTRMFLSGVTLPVKLEFQYAISDPASA